MRVKATIEYEIDPKDYPEPERTLEAIEKEILKQERYWLRALLQGEFNLHRTNGFFKIEEME